MDHNDRCEDCTYYTSWPKGDVDQGLCKRYAPKPKLVKGAYGTFEIHEQDYSAVWPFVLANEGCGEFSPKAGTQA